MYVHVKNYNVVFASQNSTENNCIRRLKTSEATYTMGGGNIPEVFYTQTTWNRENVATTERAVAVRNNNGAGGRQRMLPSGNFSC